MKPLGRTLMLPDYDGSKKQLRCILAGILVSRIRKQSGELRVGNTVKYSIEAGGVWSVWRL